MEKPKPTGHEPGDGVTCYNALPLAGNKVAPPVKVGQGYMIKEIYTCGCGQEHFDVGLLSIHNWISCYNCTKELPRGTEIHWCHPNRFDADLNVPKTQ